MRSGSPLVVAMKEQTQPVPGALNHVLLTKTTGLWGAAGRTDFSED